MMTREEAISRIQDHMERHRIGKYPHIRLAEAFDLALTALRPVSREQVEKVWRGKWIKELRQTYIPVEYDEQGEVILHDAGGDAEGNSRED